tara:strand:- start:72 stop:260 length:189 start_codon:yes stop_codon:yes gene_type:complete
LQGKSFAAASKADLAKHFPLLTQSPLRHKRPRVTPQPKAFFWLQLPSTKASPFSTKQESDAL